MGNLHGCSGFRGAGGVVPGCVSLDEIISGQTQGHGQALAGRHPSGYLAVTGFGDSVTAPEECHGAMHQCRDHFAIVWQCSESQRCVPALCPSDVSQRTCTNLPWFMMQ